MNDEYIQLNREINNINWTNIGIIRNVIIIKAVFI